MTAMRRLRKVMAGNAIDRERLPFNRHTSIFFHAEWLVRLFYIFNLFFVYQWMLPTWKRGLGDPSMSLLWPVSWVDLTGPQLGAGLIVHLSIISSLAAVVFSQHRIVRALVFLSILQTGAFINSFGGISHGFHEWIWVAFCLIFLPDGAGAKVADQRAKRMHYLTVIVAVQALILFFYTMSGLWKVLAASIALVSGKVGGFSPDAMALILADRIIQSDTAPLWAPAIIDNPVVGWPLYLALYYVELVSIMVLFRPALHRIWGLILIAFHIGTVMLMDIAFPTHVLINAMIFVFSPFAPAALHWRDVVVAIPGIALGVKLFRRRHRNGINQAAAHYS